MLSAKYGLVTGAIATFGFALAANGRDMEDYSPVESARWFVEGTIHTPDGGIAFWAPPEPGPGEPRPTSHAYQIHFFNERIKEGLYHLLASEADDVSQGECFFYLGVWAMLEPAAGDFERLAQLTEKLEKRASIQVDDKVSILGDAYTAIGRVGTREATEFLEARLDPEFWKAGLPTSETVRSDGAPVVETAQTQAAGAYAMRGDEESIRYLKRLVRMPEVQGNGPLARTIATVLDLAPLRRKGFEENLAYYRFVRGEARISSNNAKGHGDTLPRAGDHALPQPVVDKRSQDAYYASSPAVEVDSRLWRAVGFACALVAAGVGVSFLVRRRNGNGKGRKNRGRK